MRDTITIGAIAGLVSTTVMTIFVWVVRLLGFQFITTWETAANIFLNKSLLHTPIGYLVGFVSHYALGAIFGVLLAYTLRLTGKDFYILKGIGLGAFIWLASIGYFMKLLHIELEGRSHPFSNLMAILEFNIIGIVCSTIIKKYAKFKIK